MRYRLATALALGLLAACTTPEPPPPPPPPPTPAPPPVMEPPPPVDPATRVDRLCRPLLGIVDAEPAGFSSLRGAPAGPRAWQGRAVPDGFYTCEIDGPTNPGAQYVCRGNRVAGGGAKLLEDDFDRIASDLDACLARSEWYPRNWQRGEVMLFAGGERQLVWRDLAPNPRPAIALKIEEEIATRVYFLRLAVFTLF
ncbi:MAG: hypothetical protein H6852_09755 [Geminicoccaceae bacterium]|nr:hypothetical protein [Geminicoccaceae bacterium]MCB9967904.1 hypothetical protein [Geminicoccaceae bacterium]